MFFIVSTGRSGTTTIAETLSLVPGCICIHEPAPQLILESSGYRYGTVEANTIKKILKSTRKPRRKGSIYCESNQTLSLIIPILREAFPKARYIWLLRNGLDAVESAYRKQWYSGHSEKHDRYEDCPPLQRAWIDGRIEGDRCGEMSSEEWQNLDRLGKCCWYWSYINRTIETDLERYAPGAYTTIHLEDFDVELPNLLKWMDFSPAMLPQAKRHNISKREPYHWSNWTAEQRQTFEHWCSEQMDRYYPNWRSADGTWQDIEYRSRSGLMAVLGGKYYDLVQLMNNGFSNDKKDKNKAKKKKVS